jgi:hypothetical protein
MPRPIEINETFGTKGTDTETNWPAPTEKASLTNAQTLLFFDDYGPKEEAYDFLEPRPVNPGEEGHLDPVLHLDQEYRAGSLDPGRGVFLKSHTLRYYRGRARQT